MTLEQFFRLGRVWRSRDDTILPSVLARYGLALVAPLIAVGLSLQMARWSADTSPYPLFLAAVMVSSWYGGFGAGLSSILVGTLAINYFFLSPLGSIRIDTLGGVAQLTVSLLVAGLISSLNDRRRRAEARVRTQALRLRVLNEVAYELAGTRLDLTTTLQMTAARTSEAIGDGCLIRVRSEAGGRLEPLAVHHPESSILACLRDLLARAAPAFDEELAAGVTRSGRPVVILERAAESLLPLGTSDPVCNGRLRARHLVVAPLATRERVLGTLTVWRDVGGAPYTDDDGRFLQDLAVCAALAIDNARLYGEAVEAEARYRSLFEGAADAILVTERDGRVIDVNPAAGALLGHDAASLRRRSMTDLAAGGWPALWELAEGKAGDARWRGEVDALRADGSPIPVEASVAVVALPGRRGFLATLRDISERRRLAQAQQDFLAGVSHDLQTPLTAIRTGVVLVARSAAGRLRPDERELLIHARANSERLGRLIGDLLTLNRLDAGALQLDLAPTDLRLVLGEAAEAVHALLREKGQTLDLDLPDPLPIVGDRKRLEQAVINLLANAHRHTPAGTRIAVAGREDSDGVHLAVKDNGPGIPPRELDAIFERFHRLDPSGSGAGLGLALARGLVELHGGRIWAECPVGGGTVVRVVLPSGRNGGGA